jgi:hypothetical protein
MRSSRTVFLILCLLCAGLVAACGDEENGGGSAEDFIADADQICKEAAEEVIANPQPTPTTAEEAVPVLEASIERREGVLADFEALGDPPSDIADDWNQVLSSTEQRVENTKKLLKFAQEGVAATSERYASVVSESGDLEDEENKTFESLGSTACAEVLPPEEREEITALVTEFETEPLDDCTEFMTDDAIDLLFGSVEECQRIQENPPPEGFTEEVNVTQIEGIADVTATVDASLKGGIGDGQKVTYTLVYVDGRYKIDAVTAQA